MPRHLFGDWPHVAARVREASALRLFLDFDGTLAPFSTRPDTVRIAPGMRRALDALIAHGVVRTAIVSGRRRADLVRRIRMRRIEYWGFFGAERLAATPFPPETRAAVSDLRHRLSPHFAELEGVWIEDKGIGLSIHCRDASPESVRRARWLITRELAGRSRTFRLIAGEKLWNVVPASVRGKGAAVRQEVARLRKSSLAIYVGDDATDEPAFHALRDGITICVGAPRPTFAQYRLSNPDQVRQFLERLDGVLT